jgi:uncharacterized protein YjdB
MLRVPTALLRTLLPIGLVALGACGDGPGVKPPAVATVSVTPSSSNVLVGETATFIAAASKADGTVISGRAVTWTSSAPSIATVTNGSATATAPGTTTITATIDGVAGSAQLSVRQPVAAVTVTPPTSTLAVGATLNLTATARDAAGAALADRPIAWVSSNPSVATVSSTGSVAVLTFGPPVTVTATSEGRSGTATLTIIPPVAAVTVSPPASTVNVGSTVNLTATVRDAAGNALTGRAITWTSSSPSVANVSSTGTVTVLAFGPPVTITATTEGRSGTATITIVRPVASVTVTPPTNTVSVGATLTLTATPRDDAGVVLLDRTITWTSSNPAVATVSSTGNVSVLAVGPPVTMTATSEGRSGSATITIIQPVASVVVTPATTTVSAGSNATLTAVTRDADGNILTGRITSWTSSDASIAIVAAGANGTGIVTGVAPGTVTIRAAAGDRSATAQLVVTPAPVTVNGVTLDQDSLPVGAATVEFWQNGARVGTVTSDAQGRFTRASVVPGQYELRLARFGYVNASLPVVVSSASGVLRVFLRLEDRPVAGVARFQRIEQVGNRYVFEADIFVLDATGQSVPLEPSAFSMPSTRITFDLFSMTTGTTPTITNSSTFLSLPFTSSVLAEDTAQYRLRLSRVLARQTIGGDHRLALGAFGFVFPAQTKVFSNGFTNNGALLIPSIDSLGLPVTRGGPSFEDSHPTFRDFILANTPISSRSLVLISDGDYTASASTTLAQFRTLQVPVHTVGISLSASNREGLARMATRAGGISMPIVDFRQLEAAKQALPRIVRGGLPYYRLRWNAVRSGTSLFTESLRIQLPTGVISIPISIEIN